jgi:hypothetical protein
MGGTAGLLWGEMWGEEIRRSGMSNGFNILGG